MPPAGYALRVLRLAQLFAILSHHPDGLPLDACAAELGIQVATLRADLGVFMNRDVPAEVAWSLPGGVGVEFTGPGGEEADSADAVHVRLTSNSPLTELGLEYVGADLLGPLYRAATDLLALEPDNDVLRQAVARLTETLMAGVDGTRPFGGELAAELRRAARERRQVRIVYARAWRPGVGERVIEPYRVVSTRRGFEVDAGPVDEAGDIRTFLVSGIRSLQVLEETFQRPPDVDALVARAREVTTVRLVVPREAAWVVDRFSEGVTVVRADEDLELVAEVLPPVRDRVGLILTVAGPEAFVVEPETLRDAGAQTAARLLAHHGLEGSASSA
jgi:predicted DNA-binding transcriptional regulator YafY